MLEQGELQNGNFDATALNRCIVLTMLIARLCIVLRFVRVDSRVSRVLVECVSH